MGILLPAALGLLALAVPIVVLYMLRLRRQELRVSSSMLWRRAVLDRTANAPWQRLRRNLLLLLQLLLLALLVLSLARPFIFAGSASEGNTVVVLDASASMQATDEQGGITRFDRAKREAAALVDALDSSARMTVILAGPVPRNVVAASGSRAALHSAIDALAPSNGRASMSEALTLAAASAKQLGDGTAIVLLSDGALAGAGDLPEMPFPTRYINVGASARNVAITSLSLRESPSGPQLFAGLYNSGDKAATALLSIRVGGELRDSRSIAIAPGGEETLTLGDLPLDTALVEGRLTVDEPGADELAADNAAWAVRARAAASNVLLVSAGNGFLERGLSLLPGLKLSKTTPGSYAPSEGFGLTVLDATMPGEVPGGSLLLFAPPPSALVPVSGTLAYPTVGQVAVNDPLLRYADLSNLHLAVAQRMIVPLWARVLVSATTGEPLIIAGETGGRRVVAFAFDLHQSDLPLQVAFPILLANIVEWLQPSTAIDAPELLGAGDPVSIRALPEATEIVVTPPGEGAQSVTLRPTGSVVFAGTDALGVYTVVQRAGDKALGEPQRFAVNLFSRDESNIAPNPALAFGGTGGQAGAESSGQPRPLEIWPWLLLASLGLLAVEWWVYNRGGVRRKPRLG